MQTTKKIATLVVVYNIPCEESITCQALKGMKQLNMTVLIYDNSTCDYGNEAYCSRLGWSYLGGKGNVGLSRAYNTCIDYLKEKKGADILCLFDDDTDITEAYFHTLKKGISDTRKRIFVPLIYSKKGLFSPFIADSHYHIHRFLKAKDALSYHGKRLSAINSGMAIDLCVFDDYRYDENIFLDGVDHNFVMDMRNRGNEMGTIPYRCNHHFSGDNISALHSAKDRFSIYAKDYGYIFRNEKKRYWLIVGKRALRLMWQFKEFSFLRIYKQNMP